MLDLTTLDTSAAAEAGAVMEVLHPTTGAVLTDSSGAIVSITLAGEDSDRYRRALRASANRRLKSRENGRRVSMTVEEIENDQLETVVACTISWSGLGKDGVLLECTPENARSLYKQLPWLREQAEAFIADRSRFLKASATT